MVWHGGKDQMKFTPPHDHHEARVEEHLPKGDGAAELIAADDRVADAAAHAIRSIDRREKEGELRANSIWLWGHGRAPQMQTFGKTLRPRAAR